MKRFVGRNFWMAAASCAGILTAGMAAADSTAMKVNVAIKTIYAPVGFDDNDQTQLVVEGYLPNSCYKLGDATASVDQNAKTITVTQSAFVYSTNCLMMLVPYSSVINVGILAKGSYQVSASAGGATEQLGVAESHTAGPDDYLYAPIDNAYVESTDQGLVATIEGRFTSTCMQLADAKIIYTGKTIELLPVMTNTEGAGCEQKEVPFHTTYPLTTLPVGRYLLHVRSLNGHSLNALFPVFQHGDPIF